MQALPSTEVEIDDSEYPFLVGTVCKEGDLRQADGAAQEAARLFMPPAVERLRMVLVPYSVFRRSASVSTIALA